MSDPHARFLAWLAHGAAGEPVRDLAIHASVCPDCQRWIAAYDGLAAVDPGLAAQVPPRRYRDVGGALIGAGRLASALAGVVIAAAMVGLGAAQLVGAIRGAPANGEVAVATDSPEQQVGPGNGTPQPTRSFSETASPDASGPSGSGAAFGTRLPIPTPRPTIAPGHTAPPTPVATAVATPVPTPVPTDTPTPTPIPPPAPTIPDAPFLTASTGGTGEILLSWTKPGDGGDPITGYDLYRDGTFFQAVGAFQNAFPDTGLLSGQEYFYYVVARNGIGASMGSNPASALAGP